MSRAQPGVPQIKGAPMREFIGWWSKTHGTASVRAAFAALDPDVRALLDGDDAHLGIVSSLWYPAPAVHQLVDRLLVGRSPAEVNEIARGAAEAVIANTLRGVYRVLFETMMSPARYAKNAQKLFSRYYDAGVMTKQALSPTSHLSTITDWRAHHPFLCELILYTGVFVYRAMGCKDVKMERKGCISRGAAECSFITSWSDR